LKIITITDHNTHGSGESIYPLLSSISKDNRVEFVDVGSRGLSVNESFFTDSGSTQIVARRVDPNFSYSEDGGWFEASDLNVDITDYDALFIRLDRPVTDEFLDSLSERASDTLVVNEPSGVKLTGSKQFLLSFPELCPPQKLCTTIKEIEDVVEKFPTVLKPLHGYGGKGIIRIDGARVWDGQDEVQISEFRAELIDRLEKFGPFLAVKYLKNIHLGDKRVIVVNGSVVGAMLRIPKHGSWLANMTQGGTTEYCEIEPEEHAIAERISPEISDAGVAVFGFDTLVDDSGKRVLSEINTLNVGGFLQAEQHSGKPIVDIAAKEIVAYLAQRL